MQPYFRVLPQTLKQQLNSPCQLTFPQIYLNGNHSFRAAAATPVGAGVEATLLRQEIPEQPYNKCKKKKEEESRESGWWVYNCISEKEEDPFYFFFFF